MASYADISKHAKEAEKERKKQEELVVAEFVSQEFTPLFACFSENMKKKVESNSTPLACFECPLSRDYSHLTFRQKKAIENRIERQLQKQGWNTRYISCYDNLCSQDESVSFFNDHVGFSMVWKSFKQGSHSFSVRPNIFGRIEAWVNDLLD